MARTYPEWPAQKRVASRVQGLSRFESLRLQAFSRDRVSRIDILEHALGDEVREKERILREWMLQHSRTKELESAFDTEVTETRRVLQAWEREHANTQELAAALGKESAETLRLLQEWILMRDRAQELEKALSEEAQRSVFLATRVEALENAELLRASKPWRRLTKTAARAWRRVVR